MENKSFESFPGKNDWKPRVIRTLYEWSSRDDSLEMLQFYTQYKIPRTTFYQWLEAHPEIKEAYEFVKLTLASRRRIGTINKKFDGYYAYRDMHMYDSEWKQVDKYHADLKKEEAAQSHVYFVDGSKPKVTPANTKDENE